MSISAPCHIFLSDVQTVKERGRLEDVVKLRETLKVRQFVLVEAQQTANTMLGNMFICSCLSFGFPWDFPSFCCLIAAFLRGLFVRDLYQRKNLCSTVHLAALHSAVRRQKSSVK